MYAGLSFLPAGLLVLGVFRRRRNFGAWRGLGLAIIALRTVTAISGCGASSMAPPVTPAGTSAIKVIATSGMVSQTTTISLTVQ